MTWVAPGHERERAVADGVDHRVEVLGVADALLRVVERAQAARVALDGRFGAPELVDVADRQDVRAGGVSRRLGEQ